MRNHRHVEKPVCKPGLTYKANVFRTVGNILEKHLRTGLMASSAWQKLAIYKYVCTENIMSL